MTSSWWMRVCRTDEWHFGFFLTSLCFFSFEFCWCHSPRRYRYPNYNAAPTNEPNHIAPNKRVIVTSFRFATYGGREILTSKKAFLMTGFLSDIAKELPYCTDRKPKKMAHELVGSMWFWWLGQKGSEHATDIAAHRFSGGSTHLTCWWCALPFTRF